MKKSILALGSLLFIASCTSNGDPEAARREVVDIEKAFEQLVAEKGMAEAFYYFADENAVIKRADSLITGKDNIRDYYSGGRQDVDLTWSPDFVDVSNDGTLAYTYGKYVYTTTDTAGNKTDYTGVFHTVWKKVDGDWKFVWD